MPLSSLQESWEVNDMAKIYYKKIKAGQMTIDDVPERWRAEVEEMLKEDE